jgi:YegS/Rv2252/BmrU family lipid kinase
LSRTPQSPFERVAVVINPISGTGRSPDVVRRRAELAAALLEARGMLPEVFVTERPGHARELTLAALTRGATIVVAWGGDGTVNEVASALAFRNETLAIVPSGSGNGLARELGIPRRPDEALRIVVEGADRVIDAGELDGRLFFNVAGVGLDARVARRFAAAGPARRGLTRYVGITLSELLSSVPSEHTVVVDGESLSVHALFVAIANSRQYGNGAIIAPAARLDDGKLDVVVVAHRPAWLALAQVPRMFSGQIGRLRDVTLRTAVEVEIVSAHPLLYHVDGEAHTGGHTLEATVHPGVLRVRAPIQGSRKKTRFG